ncbi:hypothetical protein RGU72_14510 [Undibacterium sp. 5I1]|uniref:hypothetical protein n=1 Tax=unclassified Undibacterium TaxID=2630295 RepID=UPI002AB519B2|nr:MULTISPECIES: hypothetical protein [unclassified Undibacterium]MDY7539467.1 hypothetical protein [Undibacterium sp. 5I1]MEB0230726.1 hypothetical protein [Undibacterium sp. 10I3]MEB0258795.1 hypothetical protein [Undibacterium sp. 5I1]
MKLPFKVGSALWLLAHECRMFVYDMGGGKTNQTDSKTGKVKAARRGVSTMGKISFSLLFVLAHLGVWSIMRKVPALKADPSAVIIMGAGALLAVVFSLMLSFALNRSVKVLFERADLDLLLSSPLSSRSIFSVRLIAVVLGVASLFLLLLTPVAHVGLLLGQPRWLGIYPVLLSLAVIASSFAMLLTLGLVRWLGVRRTLTVAQLIGALTGASIFLVTQIFNNLSQDYRQRVFAVFQPLLKADALMGAQSWLWLPARALFGSPLSMLMMASLGLASFLITVHLTHRFFVRGVQQVGGMASTSAGKQLRTASAIKLQFRSGLWRSVVVKEWRLILRDPQLISQVLLQLLYMLPMFFVAFKNGAVLPGVAAMLTFISGSLSASLIWVIVSAEDAPDLLRAAPANYHVIRNAKLSAAVLPVFVLLLPFLCWMTFNNVLLGLSLTVMVLLSMSSAALMNLWLAQPGQRAQFNKRGKVGFVAGLLDFFSGVAWAATTYVSMQFGLWGFLPLTIGLLVLGAAWLMRTKGN